MERWKYGIKIKHLEINQILALNNPYGVDMPLNKWIKLLLKNFERTFYALQTIWNFKEKKKKHSGVQNCA